MNELQTFSNAEFGSIRTLEKDGEPWFVAADVCRALEINNSRMAVSRLDDDEKNTVSLTDGNRGNPNVTLVNEPGLYTLVIGSRKPEAKQFKRWITHEVIPAIRKHGAYMTKETIEKVLLTPDFIIGLAGKLKEEQEANKELRQEIEKYEIKNNNLKTVNSALAADISTWDNRSIIIALIRKYSSKVKRNVFAFGWNEFYKNLEYKYSINLKTRKSHDSMGKNKKLLDYIKVSEVPYAIKTGCYV